MKRAWILLVVGFSFSMAQSPRVLTLDDAVELGMRSSKAIKLATTRADQARAHLTEARAQRLPSLAASGGYTRIQEGKFRLSTTNLPQPLSVGDVVPDNIVLRVGLRQALFTGFRLQNAADAAALNAEASSFEVARAEENVEFAVIATYWSLYQAREMLRSAEENVKRLQSYRDDAQRLVKAGLMTTNDELKVEVQYSNSQIARLEARDAARLAEIDLNLLLDLPAETTLSLASRPDEVVVADTLQGDVNIGDLIDQASVQRRDLSAASLRIESAHAAVRAAQGAWWPQIELTANYLYNNPNSRYQPITPEFLGSWDVGVSVGFELWNWGATGSRVEQAEAAVRQAELAKQDLRDHLSREVQEAVLAVQRAREKIRLARLVLSQARENLRVETDRFKLGLASPTDLLDAEVSLVAAQTQSSGAEVEYALSIAALERSMGSERTAPAGDK